MHKFLNQLKDNEKVEDIFLISDKQLRTNKNGNFYMQFNISDKTGVMNCRLWNADEELFYQFDNEEYVLIRGATQRFQGALQFIAVKLAKVEGEALKDVNEADYRRLNSVDIPKKKARLAELLRAIQQPELRNLADCFLIDDAFMEQFCKAPAGVKLHHAYAGGLLEHTVQVMELAYQIGKLYPDLNSDLLSFGAFLHDIGKTKELAADNGFVYTDIGQMLGHPFLGVEVLNAKIAETEKLMSEPFPTETAMFLKHFLISHHGTYDNQSAKLPMTLEAMTLHFLDSIDSKIAEFRKYIMNDPNYGSHWTDYIPGIERKLYKGERPV
ncbi:MAG: HD domain-containing protein [Planctomycetaceae bacterium]|nr:HD domain-containing protein [Planctomycetaceae bacterium]